MPFNAGAHSNVAASANCSARPLSRMRHGRRVRFSLNVHASASSTRIPKALCRAGGMMMGMAGLYYFREKGWLACFRYRS